jgi:hypothetical protein
MRARQARQGEKMLELRVHLFTNGIAKNGKIQPRHAWGCGTVSMERNDAHGVIPQKPKMSNSLLELPGTVEKTLIDHGIAILPSRRMKKYLYSK